MTAVIEAGVGDVHQIKQAAAGTIEPVGSTFKHLRKVGDKAMKAAKTLGSEEWVDGENFGSPGHYVDTIGGDVGGFVSQVQPGGVDGFLAAQIIGSDVVTGASDPYTHTIATSSAQGPVQTIRAKTGVNVGPFRQGWGDALVNKAVMNCGQDQKVMHWDQDFMALKAAVYATSSPSATDSGTDPYNWAEAVGALTIDATAFPEIDGETLEIDRKLDVHRGDSPAPVCFVYGKGEVMRTFSALVTDSVLPVLKAALYGSATPSHGDAVTSAVADVALESTYTRSASRSIKITTPKVLIRPDDWEVFPRAEGGKIPIAFTGRCVKDGSTALLTIVVKSGDSAAYV